MNVAPEHSCRPIGIDLFAGAGGLSLGFEQAGFDVVAAVEIDPIHCAVHDYNFPNTATLCMSVADVTGAMIRQQANLADRDLDCVFGGAPCQGFSVMGKRALDDPRNQLVFHYVRLVQELRPKYCVFENVKGLTVGKHKQFLAELIEALSAAGYDVVQPYQVLNAADYGVPQDRKRLFLLGARRGLPLPAYPQVTERVNVQDAIGDLPDAEVFAGLIESDSVSVDFKTHATYARRLRGLDYDPTDLSYPRIFDLHRLTSSMRTDHSAASRQRFDMTLPGTRESISRFHKLDPEGLCNTLRAGTDRARGGFTSPRPIHPFLPRVITVREAARLHSYPDWFRFHVTKWHGFRQIGNSVPPLLGRAVAREIVQVLGVLPEKPSVTLEPSSEVLLRFDMKRAAEYFQVSATVIAKRKRVKAEND